MKHIYVIFIAVLLLISCSVTKDLGGKVYSYRSKKRTLQLIFVNDSLCKLRNTFHCKDIDSTIKELIVSCKYERVKDTIYLQNVDCKNSNCEYGLIINIPIQNSKECYFLNEEYRNRKSAVGPNYVTDYKKYGSVPLIDIDTLYIQKNRIILYKQNEQESVGFIFR